MIPTENYGSFRTRLLLSVLIPSFILPILLGFASIHFLKPYVRLSLPLQILAIILSIPVVNFIRFTWSDILQRRDARRLGAQLIPRVKTKWPGNLDLVLKMASKPRTDYMLTALQDLMKEYKSTTLNMRIFWGDQIVTIDEGIVKFVLATGFDNFDKGYKQKETLESFLGSGIFNRDGAIWKQHRATARPFFARERVVDFEHFERFSNKTLDIMSKLGETDAVDVQDLFARFTLDTAGAFLFNTEMDTLSLPLPSPRNAEMGPKGSVMPGSSSSAHGFAAFATAFESVQQVTVKRTRSRGLWQLAETIIGDQTKKYNDVIKAWLDPIVERTLKEKADREKTEKGMSKEQVMAEAEHASFLEYLASSTDDVAFIRDELLNILLASRDTTASLLTSVVYLCTQHPEVLKKLRAEISATCGLGANARVPTYDDLRGMKYLRAVLNETLRLFPPVPGNTRCSKDKPVLIPATSSTSLMPIYYYMPPRTNISYMPMLIHKRHDLWGEDADEFDPERWLEKDRIDRMVKNPLMFVPFNAGPRICLGQQFALNEASFFLTRLLQTYSSFELALDAQPPASLPPPHWKDAPNGRASREKVWYDSALTLFIKGGLWVRFKKAGVDETF